MQYEWKMALIGGILIGIAVSIMLLFNGRVTGVSGIVSGLLSPRKGDLAWRIQFVLGLLAGGFILRYTEPASLAFILPTGLWVVVLGGLCVGVGTAMSGGCTSGHGVCGISRLSGRSVVATITFIIAGIATVAVLRATGILP